MKGSSAPWILKGYRWTMKSEMKVGDDAEGENCWPGVVADQPANVTGCRPGWMPALPLFRDEKGMVVTATMRVMEKLSVTTRRSDGW
jgi:hypothetical protein